MYCLHTQFAVMTVKTWTLGFDTMNSLQQKKSAETIF